MAKEMGGVNIETLAEALYVQRQVGRQRKRKWEDLATEKREVIYKEIRVFLRAIGSIEMSIVPVSMVKEAQVLKLRPVQEMERAVRPTNTTFKSGRRRS